MNDHHKLANVNRASVAVIGFIVASVIFLALVVIVKFSVKVPAIDADRAAAISQALYQIRTNEVTVLTGKALKPSEIKVEVAQKALEAANSGVASTPEAQTARRKNQERARAQLHLAKKTAGN